MLFCPCVLWKATAHVETKALNMRHQAQKGFRGIFVGIPQHQQEYFVYVPSTRKIISSYDVVFDEMFSNALAYTSQLYSEAMVMLLAVTYTPCATYSRKQTGNIITFAQFEKGNLLTKNRNDTESGDKSDDESIMTIDSGDEIDHDTISTEMLEDIYDGSQTDLNVNIREARYEISDHIRQMQLEWKGELKST